MLYVKLLTFLLWCWYRQG